MNSGVDKEEDKIRDWEVKEAENPNQNSKKKTEFKKMRIV